MEILIACHKPPSNNHPNLFFVNKNRFIEPKTRKRSVTRIRNNSQGNHVFYLDTDTNPPISQAPNFFSTWPSVPADSMDIIWTQFCPTQIPFSVENIYWSIQGIEGPVRKYTDDGRGITHQTWSDLLLQGRRILKIGGKIVVPIPEKQQNFEGLSPYAIQLLILSTFRIINMEICPDYLFKAYVFAPHSPEHKMINNLFIGEYLELMKDQFKKWMLLVIDKPDPKHHSWNNWNFENREENGNENE